MKPSLKLLTGKTTDHLVTLEGTEIRIHSDAHDPYRELEKAAAADGFVVKVASGYRDYFAQLRIWNEKAVGKRPLLDSFGQPLDYKSLGPKDVLAAILRWSAIPGASRHHWGTELDVFAHNLLPSDYELQLTPSEGAPGGIFFEFSRWLEDHLPTLGFFRPYRRDKGGVSPEWWHISYAPISQLCYEAYTQEVFEAVIAESDMELKSLVLHDAPNFYEKYVRNISPP